MRINWYLGDELASDSYPMTLIDDIVYEVQAKVGSYFYFIYLFFKSITITESGNYDIGGNPSQGGGEGEEVEVQDEGFESSTQTVINLVAAHKLQPTSFDKKSYLAYIKNYMKTLLAKLKENGSPRVDVFQKNVQPFVQKLVSDFSKFDGFYIGENDVIS